MFTVIIENGGLYGQRDFFNCDKVSISEVKQFSNEESEGAGEFCMVEVGLLTENEEWDGCVECSTGTKITTLSNGIKVDEFIVPSYKEKLDWLAMN